MGPDAVRVETLHACLHSLTHDEKETTIRLQPRKRSFRTLLDPLHDFSPTYLAYSPLQHHATTLKGPGVARAVSRTSQHSSKPSGSSIFNPPRPFRSSHPQEYPSPIESHIHHCLKRPIPRRFVQRSLATDVIVVSVTYSIVLESSMQRP